MQVRNGGDSRRRRAWAWLAMGLAGLFGAGNAGAQEEDFEVNFTFDLSRAIIANYIGSGGNVNIPATIYGTPVVAIGNQAFAGKTNVTTITVPAGVTNVGNHAFATNANLTGVYFRGNAPVFGTGIFSNSPSASVYCLTNTTGWVAPIDGRPIVIYEISTIFVWPPIRTVNPAASSATFGVGKIGGNMRYETSEDETWLAIVGGGQGTNNGTITVTCEPNPGATARMGTVTISSPGANGSPTRVVIIQESANPTPRLMITPPVILASDRAGTEPFMVTNTGVGTMAYVATESESWLHIAGGGSGTNGGTIAVSFTNNAGATARTGTVVVTALGASGSPAYLTIIQSATGGVSLAIAPLETNLSSAATAGHVLYVAATGTWTTVEHEAWITVDSGSYGFGNGLVSYRVSANPEDDARTGHIVVFSGGYARTCTVNQAAARSLLEISPFQRTHSSASASGLFVGVRANVRWTASANRSWITITAGGSGSGNGLVAYRVSANDGVARSGTITVTGAGIVRTFKVVQSAWVDPYEPDDSPSAAKLITKGVLQNRSIHKVGNADWARFKVGGGGALNLQIETSGPVGDTHMWLIRSDGTRQAYDNDGGTGDFSRITAAFLAPGIYYIKIREYGSDGTIPRYTLQARWTTAPIAADAYEPDGTRSTARRIVSGQVQDRSIHAAGNVDWVRFRVSRAGARNVRLETSGSDGNTEMWLYDAAGARLLYDDDSGTGRFARIRAAALAPGTYYIRVQERGNNGRIAAYRLQASWASP